MHLLTPIYDDISRDTRVLEVCCIAKEASEGCGLSLKERNLGASNPHFQQSSTAFEVALTLSSID